MPEALINQRKFILDDVSTGRSFLCVLPETHVLVRIFDQIEDDLNCIQGIYFWTDFYTTYKGASFLASCIYACSRNVQDIYSTTDASRLSASYIEIFDDVYKQNCNMYAQAFIQYSGVQFESIDNLLSEIKIE